MTVAETIGAQTHPRRLFPLSPDMVRKLRGEEIATASASDHQQDRIPENSGG